MTTSLHRAVPASAATTVLPGLAYDGAFITAGQAVMTMHVPTYSAPSIMLPSLQGSKRHLFKRAPIPEGEWESFDAKHCADECKKLPPRRKSLC